MKNSLLILMALIFGLTLSHGQETVVLEDFEDGGKLNWNQNIGDGEFSIVENPALTDTIGFVDTLGINPGGNVGSYTKDSVEFSLLIAELDNPLDLSTNNKFTVQVLAPVATSFIFKIEGDRSIGEELEEEVNIAAAGIWVEYTFDFSAAADFTTINKIIFFFDRRGTDGDTYLIDNIRIEPADECSGVAEVPGLVDDFECQRNRTVGVGLLSLDVIDNPDISGINMSSTVGAFNDSDGGAFHALVYDYGFETIDLSTNNIFKMSVWAPFANRLVVKLEGGTNFGPVERDFQIEATEEWVEVEIDFSDLANSDYTRVVFFFNAFEAPGEEDIFFVDDVRWEEVPMGDVLEDFEDGGQLTWEPLNNNNEVHGTFEIIDNPDMEGNESASIGSYTKGTSAFSTLTTFLPGGIDLSEFSQLNLQVWAPEGASMVTMQLVSQTQGNQSVTRDIPETMSWQDINFNFEEFQNVTDFFQLNLIFDEGVESAATYFLDNLSQGAGTVDPCEGVEPVMNIIDDFNCQRNVPITIGIAQLEVIDNPDMSGINNTPNDRVGAYDDPFDQFSALVYNFGGPINLDIRNQLTVKIWSPEIVPLLFKLEGGSDPVVEIPVEVTEAGTWVEYVVDFSESAGTDHTSLAIFFNFNQIQEEQLTYFIDDISLERAPYGKGLIADFESPDFELTNWGFFPDGDADPGIYVVENPNPSGINTSDNVGYHVEIGNGPQPWAGMFHRMEAPISLPNDDKVIRMKVLSNQAATIVAKVEGGVDGAPQSGDTPAEYTTPGEWQELVFDFANNAPSPVPDDALYNTFTLIFNITEIPTEDTEYFYDDVIVGSADPVSVFSPVKVDQLEIAPNPVNDRLNIMNAEDINHFEVYNTFGQRVHIIQTTGQNNLSVSMDHLTNGIYILVGFDRSGKLIGNARFTKQ